MLALLLTIAVVVLDQLTKHAILARFHPGRVVPVVPGWFNLVYVRNTGAAWGMLGGLNGWLALLSVVILLAMVIFRRALLSDRWTHRMAMGLMLGGIIGNLLDRVRLQYVVDFLDFHWRNRMHFPAFNVADAAICVGVALYILSSLRMAARPSGAAAEQQAE